MNISQSKNEKLDNPNIHETSSKSDTNNIQGIYKELKDSHNYATIQSDKSLIGDSSNPLSQQKNVSPSKEKAYDKELNDNYQSLNTLQKSFNQSKQSNNNNNTIPSSMPNEKKSLQSNFTNKSYVDLITESTRQIDKINQMLEEHKRKKFVKDNNGYANDNLQSSLNQVDIQIREKQQSNDSEPKYQKYNGVSSSQPNHFERYDAANIISQSMNDMNRHIAMLKNEKNHSYYDRNDLIKDPIQSVKNANQFKNHFDMNDNKTWSKTARPEQLEKILQQQDFEEEDIKNPGYPKEIEQIMRNRKTTTTKRYLANNSKELNKEDIKDSKTIPFINEEYEDNQEENFNLHNRHNVVSNENNFYKDQAIYQQNPSFKPKQIDNFQGISELKPNENKAPNDNGKESRKEYSSRTESIYSTNKRNQQAGTAYNSKLALNENPGNVPISERSKLSEVSERTFESERSLSRKKKRDNSMNSQEHIATKHFFVKIVEDSSLIASNKNQSSSNSNSDTIYTTKNSMNKLTVSTNNDFKGNTPDKKKLVMIETNLKQIKNERYLEKTRYENQPDIPRKKSKNDASPEQNEYYLNDTNAKNIKGKSQKQKSNQELEIDDVPHSLEGTQLILKNGINNSKARSKSTSNATININESNPGKISKDLITDKYDSNLNVYEYSSPKLVDLSANEGASKRTTTKSQNSSQYGKAQFASIYSNFVESHDNNGNKQKYDTFLQSLKMRQEYLNRLNPEKPKAASTEKIISIKPPEIKVTDTGVYERTNLWLNAKKNKIEKEYMHKNQALMRECTFKPNITFPYNNSQNLSALISPKAPSKPVQKNLSPSSHLSNLLSDTKMSFNSTQKSYRKIYETRKYFETQRDSSNISVSAKSINRGKSSKLSIYQNLSDNFNSNSNIHNNKANIVS